MATTHNNASSKSFNNTIGRHDGHQDGHLNCVALRHGWSRAFSVPPNEVQSLDYAALETILEVTTLKLRPMGVRIYVENPPSSGQWQKIRFWKIDGSLQSTLILEFFERRRVSGTVTRIDIRDGSERTTDGDGLSLRTVGSIVLRRNNSGAVEAHETERSASATGSRTVGSRWFGFSRNTSVRSNARTAVTATDVEDEDIREEQSPPTPPKPSFFSLLRPHPKIPNAPTQRRSIFDFFRTRLLSKPKKQAPTINDVNATTRQMNPFASITSRPSPFSRNPFASFTNRSNRNKDVNGYARPEGQDQADATGQEEEQLRKRGWIPPGLIRRQKSLRDRLHREGDETSRNPFFGSSRSGLSRAERKRKAGTARADMDTDGEGLHLGDDPFGDHAGHSRADLNGAEEISEHDVDNFFEIERTGSMVEMENRPLKDKSWTRFKSKDRKQLRDKPSAGNLAESPAKGTLGGGADIVAKPRDAFPDSPHHYAEDVELN